MRRLLAAAFAALTMAGAPIAGLAEGALTPAPSKIQADEVSIVFPAIAGFCAPTGKYDAMMARMRSLAHYDVLLMDCGNMQSGGDPFPMLAGGYIAGINGVGHNRRELFETLQTYPDSMWTQSVVAGAKESVDKAASKNLTPKDTSVDLGVTKRGYDDNGFYLTGLMLAQAGGREGVAAVGIAFTLVKGKALVLLVMRRGQSPEDIDWALTTIKSVTRQVMLANGV